MKLPIRLALALLAVYGMDRTIADFTAVWLPPMIIFTGSTLGLLLVKGFIESLGWRPTTRLEDPTLVCDDVLRTMEVYEPIQYVSTKTAYPLRNKKQRSFRAVSGK